LSLSSCLVLNVRCVDGQDDGAHFVDELEYGERGFGRPVCWDPEWDSGRQTAVRPWLRAEWASMPGFRASL